jgi:hypothetical protein
MEVAQRRAGCLRVTQERVASRESYKLAENLEVSELEWDPRGVVRWFRRKKGQRRESPEGERESGQRVGSSRGIMT